MSKQLVLTRKHKVIITAMAKGDSDGVTDVVMKELERAGLVSKGKLTQAGQEQARVLMSVVGKKEHADQEEV